MCVPSIISRPRGRAGRETDTVNSGINYTRFESVVRACLFAQNNRYERYNSFGTVCRRLDRTTGGDTTRLCTLSDWDGLCGGHVPGDNCDDQH